MGPVLSCATHGLLLGWSAKSAGHACSQHLQAPREPFWSPFPTPCSKLLVLPARCSQASCGLLLHQLLPCPSGSLRPAQHGCVSQWFTGYAAAAQLPCRRLHCNSAAQPQAAPTDMKGPEATGPSSTLLSSGKEQMKMAGCTRPSAPQALSAHLTHLPCLFH